MKNVLMISLDRNLFLRKNTDSFERQKEYARGLQSLTIIVYTPKGFKPSKVGNLNLIPTNSSSVFLGFFDFLRLIKKYKKGDFQVVSSQDPFFLGLIGILASRKLKAKFKPQLHIEAFSNPYWRKESFFNFLQYLLGLFVIRRIDSIRVVSRRSQKYMERKKIQSRFIPVSTDLEKFKVKSVSRKDIDLLYVGRFCKQKNLEFLLEVVERLLERCKGLKVHLVGDGELRRYLEKKCVVRGLEKNIIFEGEKSHDEINVLYARSKVFVLPSLYEGWGLVCIEASMAGVPVVMSDTGCAGEIIIDGTSGSVCPINNLQCFVEKIENYLNRPEEGFIHNTEAVRLINSKLQQKELQQEWVDYLND